MCLGRSLTWAAHSRTGGSKPYGYLGTELFKEQGQGINVLGRECWVWGISSRTAWLEQEEQGKTGGRQDREEAWRRAPAGLEVIVWTWVSSESSQVSLTTCILKLKTCTEKFHTYSRQYGVVRGLNPEFLIPNFVFCPLFSLFWGAFCSCSPE